MSTDAIAAQDGHVMQIPAAFQVAAPFGADVGGALLLPFERAGGVALSLGAALFSRRDQPSILGNFCRLRI